jgi:Fe-S cluster biogenesis protein NfuA
MTVLQTDLAGAVDRIAEMIRGDGGDLRLLGVDESTGTVELALDLRDASCAECVLPPQRLHDVLATGLARAGFGAHRLVLHDPRVDGVVGAGTVRVLDPTASTVALDRDPGPDAGPLAGRVVGFRVDVLWTSWDVVVDEWTQALRANGVEVRTFRREQGLPGDAGEAADREYAAMLDGVDAAVVGLGNCGSCTSWTIKDAAEAARVGRPTVAVVTAQFDGLAEMLSTHYGRPGLRRHVLPFPLQTRAEVEIRAIARAAFPALLATLGATV